MANSYIQAPPDSNGAKLDQESLTVGANTVMRQRVEIAGGAATTLAAVTNSDPSAATPALVTRDVNGLAILNALDAIIAAINT